MLGDGVLRVLHANRRQAHSILRQPLHEHTSTGRKPRHPSVLRHSRVQRIQGRLWCPSRVSPVRGKTASSCVLGAATQQRTETFIQPTIMPAKGPRTCATGYSHPATRHAVLQVWMLGPAQLDRACYRCRAGQYKLEHATICTECANNSCAWERCMRPC